MSSDEETSPAMQFTRSVRRTGRKPLASPSDSENTPTVQPAVRVSRQQPSAAFGYVRQQLGYDSPSSQELKGAGVQQVLGGVRGQQTAALTTPGGIVHADPSTQTDTVQQTSASKSSPSTPAAGRLGPLDLNDPYTPWLRTSRKPPQPTPGAHRQAPAAAVHAAETQDDDFSCSPISSASSSNASSPAQAAADVPTVLDSLCAAVADLQLKQGQMGRADSPTNSARRPGRAAGTRSMEAHAAAAAAVATDVDSPGQHTPTNPDSKCPGAPAATAAAAAAIAAQDGSSSDEDDAAPLTLGRRTAPRVFRRPMLAVDTDSSGSEAGDEASSSDDEGDHKQAGGCCATAGAHRRVTPGSTSSLVTLKRPGSSGKRRPQPTDTGYTGAYDFDAHLSTIKPPKWQLEQRQRHLEQSSMTVGATAGRSRFAIISPSSVYSASPRSPVAALSFTPAPRGKTAASAAAGAAAAAGTPRGGPRRLSGAFLGQGLPLSPPILKQQQQPGFATPAATSSRRVHTAQTDSKAAAPRPPATAGQGKPGTDLGKSLWPLTEKSADSDSIAGSMGNSLQPGELVTSRRRPKGQASGAAGKGAAAGCATAPPKAPSSRTFARQRQQMSQELYAQWNAQVFDSGLPADLALVWNPRLTATAGQVVDDGSRNHLKSSREERIPVRLELSSKVIDNEVRLRTTLSHEMCHVAAWVISKEWKEHHGAVFWAWARRFEKQVSGIKITTCHNYDVHAPFRWQCSNYSCGKLYMRHKRSIDINKHVCSRCQGRLLYLGKFSRDGQLIASSVSEAAAGAATPGGGNAFTMFVKSHFAEVKRALPTGTPHKEVMTRLAAQYKEQKAVAAATPAAPATLPRPGRTMTTVTTVTASVSAEVMVTAVTDAVTPAVQKPPGGNVGRGAATAAAVGTNTAAAGDSSDDEGWHTADEEVEEQTSSLLNFMDRLALS